MLNKLVNTIAPNEAPLLDIMQKKDTCYEQKNMPDSVILYAMEKKVWCLALVF